MNKFRPFLRSRLLGTILLLFVLLMTTYANTIQAPFNFDDEVVIKEEIARGTDFFSSLYPIKYRHLFYLSLAANYTWGGLDPVGYHLFNLLIHYLSALSVLLIVFFTLCYGTELGRKAAFFIAGTSTLLFILNPIQTEAVTYISGRASSLSGLFYFLALVLFIAANRQDLGGRLIRAVFYILLLFVLLLCVLTKETGITLIAIFLLYDLCFMRTEGWVPFRQRLALLYLPAALMGGLLLLVSPTILRIGLEWLHKADFSYALQQASVIPYSFKLILFPLNLTFDYDFSPEFFFQYVGVLLVLGIFFLSLIVIVKRSGRVPKILAFAFLWYLITIAPTNSFMPRPDLLSERNLYVPGFALYFGFATIIYQAFFSVRAANPFRARLGLLCLTIIIVSLATLAIERNSMYRSNTLLWEETLKKSPGKVRALHNLSHFYLLEKNYPKAEAALKELATSNASPYYLSYAHSNLGSLYTRLNDLKRAEREFKAGILVDPTLPTNYFNLGTLYASTKRYALAKENYEKAGQRYKDYRWGYGAPPELDLNMARVNLRIGLIPEAERQALAYLNKKPDDSEGHLFLGKLYAMTERETMAVEEYRKVKGTPEFQAIAHNNIALIFIKQGQLEQAENELVKALRQNSAMADTHLNLATLILQKGGDPKRAAVHLKAAMKYNKDPSRESNIRNLLAHTGY